MEFEISSPPLDATAGRIERPDGGTINPFGSKVTIILRPARSTDDSQCYADRGQTVWSSSITKA